MVEWMRAHSLHLQPLWDQRNVQDELTTCSFEEYLSQVEQVNAYCGFLEVYALSKGLPANILVIDETAGHHIRFASQSDADPFIVLRFVAKHYEWVRCDPAALVEIWTGAATGKTVGGRGGGPADVCLASAADSSLRSPRFMQISTDSEAESSGQGKAGGPQTIAPDGGLRMALPSLVLDSCRSPLTLKLSFLTRLTLLDPRPSCRSTVLRKSGRLRAPLPSAPVWMPRFLLAPVSDKRRTAFAVRRRAPVLHLPSPTGPLRLLVPASQRATHGPGSVTCVVSLSGPPPKARPAKAVTTTLTAFTLVCPRRNGLNSTRSDARPTLLPPAKANYRSEAGCASSVNGFCRL